MTSALTRLRNYCGQAKELGFTWLAALTVIVLHVLGTLFESVGLAIMLPVFQFIQSGENISKLTEEHSFWQYIVDFFSFFGISVTLPALLAASLFMILIRQLAAFTRLIVGARVRFGILQNLRVKAFRRFLSVDIAYLERNSTGGVVNDMTVEMQRAVENVFNAIFFVGTVMMAVIYTALLLMLSTTMVLASTVVLAFSVGALSRLLRQSTEVGRRLTAANQMLAAFLVERLRFIRLIRLSQTGQMELDALTGLSARQRDSLIQTARLVAILDVSIEPLVAAFGFVFLYVGVQHMGLRLEEMGLFLLIVLRLLPVVKEVAKTRQAIRASAAAVDAVVARIRELSEKVECSGGAVPFTELKHEIRFDKVSFCYPASDVPALKDVNLTIPAGKFVALVGPSGSGKSTLIDLLPRLRLPTDGAILIDGCDIGEYDVATLRAAISYAPQSAQVFDVTIEQHIRYGCPDASADQVRRAAELAGAADFIAAQPEGYGTMIGETGIRLSGGQRQRLDLARTLVRNSPIVVLDEPTANLDADSEEIFLQTLQKLRTQSQSTIILIGHRLSTVCLADQIVVLENGSVSAVGSHDVLVDGNNWYASAWRKQAFNGVVSSVNE